MAHQFGLKQKITLALSILVIFLISTVGFITLSIFEGQFKAIITQNQSVLVAGLACQIDETLTAAHNQLVTAAYRIPVAALRDTDRLQDVFGGMIGLRGIFDNQVLILSFANGGDDASTPGIRYSDCMPTR